MGRTATLGFGWLVLDGLGVVPILLNLRMIDLPERASVSARTAYLVAIGSTLAAVVWLGAVTGLRRWRHRLSTRASSLFVAGVCLSYLLMPLAHHVLFTPWRVRYISASSNFFPRSIGLQVTVFVVADILAAGIARLRGQL